MSKAVYRLDLWLKKGNSIDKRVYVIKSKGLSYTQFIIDLADYLKDYKIKVLSSKRTYDYTIPKMAIWLVYKDNILKVKEEVMGKNKHKGIKVKDLIARLKEMNGNAEVVCLSKDGYFSIIDVEEEFSDLVSIGIVKEV